MVMRRALVAPPPVVRPEWKPALQRVAPRPRLRAVWESWTGETWTLTDRRSPVFVLQGATGLGLGEPLHRLSEAAALHGSRWNGSRDAAGEVFLPVDIRAATTDAFLDVHAAFQRSLNRAKQSRLRIIRPDGSSRHVMCRYRSGGDSPIELDPVLTRRVKYGLTFITPDPHWHGDPVAIRFGAPAPYDFFPGPPFYLGQSVSLDRADVVNPGDVDDASSATWRVEGPFTGFQVGVGESLVKMSLTKPAGGWVEVDMDPERQTFRDETGADVSGSVTAAAFAPIPSGQTTLTTSVEGLSTTTAVELSFVPKYLAAW